mmetsp:Transcript_30948/g.59730  ORF Transcript_30948/g.59730 Transcript_30948/m.59730 type:complete len:333 (+) Transcript_30948:1054-2052(+)
MFRSALSPVPQGMVQGHTVLRQHRMNELVPVAPLGAGPGVGIEFHSVQRYLTWKLWLIHLPNVIVVLAVVIVVIVAVAVVVVGGVVVAVHRGQLLKVEGLPGQTPLLHLLLNTRHLPLHLQRRGGVVPSAALHAVPLVLHHLARGHLDFREGGHVGAGGEARVLRARARCRCRRRSLPLGLLHERVGGVRDAGDGLAPPAPSRLALAARGSRGAIAHRALRQAQATLPRTSTLLLDPFVHHVQAGSIRPASPPFRNLGARVVVVVLHNLPHLVPHVLGPASSISGRRAFRLDSGRGGGAVCIVVSRRARDRVRGHVGQVALQQRQGVAVGVA